MLQKVIALLLLAATAHADKPACEAKGTPIIEIDHLTNGSKAETAEKLYASGAWSISETTAEAKPGKTETGCADADAMKKLRAELDAAKWKITTARIRCMAISPNYTVVKVNGKKVIEQHMCDGQSLDEASAKALADARALLEPVH